MKISALAFIALVVATGGCSNAVTSPEYQVNPNPRSNYVVTAELNDSPGPFQAVTTTARYGIGPDHSCMPDAEPLSGTFPTPAQAFVHPKVSQPSATRYTAQVSVDGMAAKDYFGKGLCTWTFEGISFVLRASGAASDTRFVATLDPDDVSQRRRVIVYFKRAPYPRQATQGATEYGTPNPERFKALPASQLFTVTFTARESGHGHQQ